MNSLVFNTTADELRTSIYGYNRDTDELQLLQLTNEGELIVTATDMVITNTVLTVSGEVTVTNTVTVTGNVTVSGSVTVANTVTVVGNVTVSGDVTVTNTVSVFVDGNRAEYDEDHQIGVTVNGIAFQDLDISQFRTATLFVDNIGNTTVTVTLQISPDGVTYFNDPNYLDKDIPANSKKIIVVDTYAQFIQLAYTVQTGGPSSFNVFFNGQV